MLVRSRLLEEAGFLHGFSLRTGGVSTAPFDTLNLGRAVGDDVAAVAENHVRLAAAVGYDGARLYEVSQVHGRDVRVIAGGEDPAKVRQEKGDALVASLAATAIGVRTADCVPALVADTRGGSVAAIHAGWRGAVAGVVPEALETLARSGAKCESLRAAIGPHIRACCFEVGDDVAHELVRAGAAVGLGEADLVVRGHAKPHVALAPLVRAQLGRFGLSDAAIDDVGGCTACEPARFFSFRRDGARSGRHLNVIVAR